VSVRQIPSHTNPLPRDEQPIAILPYDLATLAQEHGLGYEEGTDNLGRYRFAAIELANGQPAWIVKYDVDANPGSLVYVDGKADVAQAEAALLEAFGLRRDELL
jgi:hypothetical protein